MSRILLLLSAFAFASAADDQVQKLTVANNEFTFASYKVLTKTRSGNLLLCGISAETVLSLLSQGARGETESELHRALSEDESSVNAYKQLVPKLNQDTKGLTLLSANKIYAAKDFEIEKSFKDNAKDAYKADVQNVDFGKNSETAEVINSWVAGKTNNKITDIVSPDQLNSNTRLVLVNALYLKAQWMHPFNEEFTENKPFYTIASESKQMPMMHLEETFRYKHYGYYKILEMPFEGGVTMTIVLPDARDGLTSLLETDVKGVLEVRDLKEEMVSVTMPKFTMRMTTDFIPILENLGVETLFDAGEADLKGISPEQGLYVNLVVQQTYINVTETGVEAASATTVGVTRKLLPEPKLSSITFIADHPFLFYLREKSSGLLLFVGRLQQ
ncbi:hypothetical protein JTB14_010895 [Gonioctena quinquepunctata]|nr:hypothetical protein JTB14_010895 [Gonioctena quinquepunctata]